MMTDDENTADAIAYLLGDFGSEDHLAAHIATRLEKLGWSQDKLAKEMSKAGVPIPQSAISKIVKPAAGGRRAITVDEALGFAKVFGVPLDELLLPDGAAEQLEVMRMLRSGPSQRQEATHQLSEYTSLVARVAAWMRESTQNFSYVMNIVEAATGIPEAEQTLETDNRAGFYLDLLNNTVSKDFQIDLNPPDPARAEQNAEEYLEMHEKGYPL